MQKQTKNLKFSSNLRLITYKTNFICWQKKYILYTRSWRKAVALTQQEVCKKQRFKNKGFS